MYAALDAQGNICGEYGSPQPEETANYAEIPEDDARVIAYRALPITASITQPTLEDLQIKLEVLQSQIAAAIAAQS